MIECFKLVIEEKAFIDFMNKYEKKHYRDKRLGQAFYKEFNLHRVNDINRELLYRLCESDNSEAIMIIKDIVILDSWKC